MNTITFTFRQNGSSHTLQATTGESLRSALLRAGFSPYTRFTQKLNCGGNGLCATCGVWLIESIPEPTHWHDKLAQRYGYPRLSCQVVVEEGMVVEAVEGKDIWGWRAKLERDKKNS